MNADGTFPTLSEMTIPRGHVFQTVFDGVSYDFVTTDTNKPTQNSRPLIIQMLRYHKEHIWSILLSMIDN